MIMSPELLNPLYVTKRTSIDMVSRYDSLVQS